MEAKKSDGEAKYVPRDPRKSLVPDQVADTIGQIRNVYGGYVASPWDSNSYQLRDDGSFTVEEGRRIAHVVETAVTSSHSDAKGVHMNPVPRPEEPS